VILESKIKNEYHAGQKITLPFGRITFYFTPSELRAYAPRVFGAKLLVAPNSH
jgi:hypothetical protein